MHGTVLPATRASTAATLPGDAGAVLLPLLPTTMSDTMAAVAPVAPGLPHSSLSSTESSASGNATPGSCLASSRYPATAARPAASNC
eukprot:CAMPEP_0202881974 /NCGR_PEP_ID=MMETSP1391-20130828/37328_1 /ASSEMBLY_ACC=CAM_ASM_000867 /TAXON_ID=1034604 /ORGANISM="Chlamydomonas leiostraca, Strain SAG 11-49" /LENGTH=86 /DNA_ID=CAMNT_0049564743 /DNA_START=115 /DNA_END=372 /DNA_ORIENTATION=+